METSFALCHKVSCIAGMKIAHTLCECVEFPPGTIHDENGVQMTAVPKIPSNNKSGKN